MSKVDEIEERLRALEANAKQTTEALAKISKVFQSLSKFAQAFIK